MGLSDIAAGIEVRDEQHDRGVAVVDETGTLRERLAPHADNLPCTAAAATVVLDSYTAGRSVGDCAREASLAPVTAAKALHRCGVDGVSPLAPEARQIVRDWANGEIPRTEAVELTGVGEREFALAAYIETHDPVPALVEAAAAALEPTASVVGPDTGGDPASGR